MSDPSGPLLKPPLIVFINGSLAGAQGNTYLAGRTLEKVISNRTEVHWAHLKDTLPREGMMNRLRAADGYVFLTGTYWDSWGSPLQRFLEDSTEFEGTDLWLGKPAAALVTMHSVGGKEVLSRLQGVLSTFGLEIPPMSAMVYSLANQLALQAPTDDFQGDLWQLKDLETVGENLMTAVERNRAMPVSWKTWPVDSHDPRRRWISDSTMTE